MDKLLFVEKNVPDILIIGNSRVDNGIDPRTLKSDLQLDPGCQIFNMGIPGANAKIFFHIFKRLESANALGRDGIKSVIIGLDEAFLQREDSLGYSIFFSSYRNLLFEKDFKTLLSSSLRLWSFSQNLKQLREPAKLIRFLQASIYSVEPVGGGAKEHLGYRAGFTGEFQDVEQISMQETSYSKAPSQEVIDYFWGLLELLRSTNISVTIVYPPLLNRELLYLLPGQKDAAPYVDIYYRLCDMNIPQIQMSDGLPKSVDDFANAGHLNDKGAQRYSKLLARNLGRDMKFTLYDKETAKP